MNQTRRCLFVFVLATLPTAARAESILDHLPAETIGFAYIHNLAQASAKIERVTKIFEEAAGMPIPAPLPVIKAATGLGAGIDEQGDAVLAALPGEEGLADVRPLLLVAVSDYAAFARSINGDATGEICRVTIAGEEVLAAKVSEYAALANVDDREQLEELVAGVAPNRDAVFDRLRPWLGTTDAAVVVTAAGLKTLKELFDTSWAPMPGIYDDVVTFFGAEADAVAAGVSIDADANVKLLGEAVLRERGKLALISSPQNAEDAPLAGFADEPYVFAGGFPIPRELADAAPGMIREFLQQWPDVYGFKELTDGEWAEVEESWRQTIAGVQGASTIVYLGEDDDPLMSNFYVVLEVDDAQGYVDAYADAERKWNELMSHSTIDIELKSEIAEIEVAGHTGLLITADALKAGEDPNVPGSRILIKAMVGEDGKSELFVAPADKNRVVVAMADKADVEKVIEAVADRNAGLAESSPVQATRKLLAPDAGLMMLVSPQGCMTYFGRFYNTFSAQLGPGGIELPEYPASPPVGVTLSISDGRASGEVVWPVETLTGVAAYFKKLQDSL